MIDAATNKVVATNPGKGLADGIAVTPDGQQTYFTNFDPYLPLPEVLVSETGNVIPLGGYATCLRHSYHSGRETRLCPFFPLSNAHESENVAIIDTATNTVVKTVLVETNPVGQAPVE